MNIHISKRSLKFMYDLFIDEENITFYNYLETLTREQLNQDGTYTLKGKCSKKVKNFMIGDTKVEVDSKTNEFSFNLPINKGRNIFKVVATVGKENLESYFAIYYDEINILVDTKGMNFGRNSVITTNKDTINLRAEISSYITINSIDVNSNNIYSNMYGKASTDGQELYVPINTTVKLKKGMNKVLIEARNMAGQTEQFTVMVNYR